MTKEQSKALNIGDAVIWDDDPQDMGRVVGADSLCVRIKWGDGPSGLIDHRDMAKVTAPPQASQ